MDKINQREEGKSETECLYYKNSYEIEFEAKVLATTAFEGRAALILDSTLFYPEGGGQPSDEGEINGVKVIQVIEQEGKILHVLEKEVRAHKVKGKIDWSRRFDHMQQHSGQHLLSQVCWEILGAETLSFHLGKQDSSIELSISHISEDEVKKIEERAAEIIFKNLPFKIYFVDEAKVEGIPFRKKPIKSGLIRVVEIEHFDYSACGGTHVRQSGEIGLIKIIGTEKIRQHGLVYFVCGFRALKDYQRKNQILSQLGHALSVPPEKIPSSVETIQAEAKTWRKKCRQLREEINRFEAEKIIVETKGLVIERIFSDRTAEEAKHLALEIVHQGNFLVIFGIQGEVQEQLILARSEGIPLDLREWLPFLREELQGKGGGSESLIQIVYPRGIPFEEVIRNLREKIPRSEPEGYS